MTDRRWTLLIVPHGSDSPHSVDVSSRRLRKIAWIAGSVALVLLTCTALVAVELVKPGAIFATSENRRLTSELAQLRGGVDLLRDTLAAIGKRDEQIRLLAGLPNADSLSEETSGGPTLALSGLATPPGIGLSLHNAAGGPFSRFGFGHHRTDIGGLIQRANVLSASFADVTDSLSRHVERMAATPSIMPTAGWLSSAFSRQRFHPILHIARPHEGIDVSAPMGAPVVAPASGTVQLITHETGYGLVLEINHGNGLVTKYAHLSRVNVRSGMRVTRGQLIANVGNSGLSTGPHLHYEIHVNGRVVDPLTYVLPDAIPD
jgi:murein DD-endopeptidase MepM/ murein hydrolase activator NlpD